MTMARRRADRIRGKANRSVVVSLGLLVAGCAAAQPTPAPSPTLGYDLSCGSVTADACAKVASVAIGTLPVGHAPLVAVRITPESAAATCPPMAVGPAPGFRICDLIVSVTTADGKSVVPFARGGDGWVLSWDIK